MKTTEIPPFIYGTAWKEERTGDLAQKAIASGFTAIDTANQKKHYREDFLGAALTESQINRDDLFLQTKFTYVRGQDHRLPYDPKSPYATQVRDSFENSLKNLHTDYIDSFLLHGPLSSQGLQDGDWEVWSAMEKLYDSKKAKAIGASNMNLLQIKALFENSRVKPKYLQNRCYASQGWDQGVREYCLSVGMIYQGFSLLTANPHLLESAETLKLAKAYQKTPQQIIFRFAIQIGILPLTGTTNEKRMKEDLQIFDFELSRAELEQIYSLSSSF